MPPIMRFPNAVPGHQRVTVNHLRRLKNSMNRQGALYGGGNNAPYNATAAAREQNIRRNIAREVGMTQAQLAPYYHKWMNLTEANNRKRGSTRSQRVNATVRRAARGFKNTRRTHAMLGQLAAASVNAGGRMQSIPPEIRRMIALAMRTNAMRTPPPTPSARSATPRRTPKSVRR